VTPISEDAPFGEQDARFWDWVFASIVAVIVLGLIVWGVVSLL